MRKREPKRERKKNCEGERRAGMGDKKEKIERGKRENEIVSARGFKRERKKMLEGSEIGSRERDGEKMQQ